MIKYSTNRLTPWQFVVTSDQSAELQSLSTVYDLALLALVCGPDGVVALDWRVIAEALQPHTDGHPAFSLLVKRRRRQQYRVSGPWSSELVAPDASFEGTWVP
jgi:hypothetical protein